MRPFARYYAGTVLISVTVVMDQHRIHFLDGTLYSVPGIALIVPIGD